jgi:hypothetical protein
MLHGRCAAAFSTAALHAAPQPLQLPRWPGRLLTQRRLVSLLLYLDIVVSIGLAIHVQSSLIPLGYQFDHILLVLFFESS